MYVEQAIFTSARTRHAQGYHLTSRSPGITDEIAQALSQWSPSHGGLLESAIDAVSLNYFPLPANRGVLARSVYGGPEYSDRGGLQIMTRMLVFQREQLAGYSNNPLKLARLALALGQLRLSGELEQLLEPVELPNQTALAIAATEHRSAEPATEGQMLVARLQTASRVAVIGAENPRELLEEVLQHTHPDDRLDVSFTTGLKPSMHRQFRVQFLTTADPRLRGQLAAQGVECVDLAV
ncbi:MAG: hypothetical protein HOL01_15310 [Planctomycetaceae bacterium]|jgi:hypothetical protein|nr:hypothetical protein [Planctomycetaceae bacterium]MBT6485100.1 hypothetical protein [Planctomycetaceae bacterium]MBT6495913.1 hypothetical protein [Planctomycetaceae bacterium]